jgi:uncharacterized protein with von Willebrand factor type A (vWA) domain
MRNSRLPTQTVEGKTGLGHGIVMISRFRRFKNDLRTGWMLVRGGTAEAVNRSLEEAELLRLKFQLYEVEDQMKEFYRAAGERAYQLMERGADMVLQDKETMRLFDQIDRLKQEEVRIRFDMEQIKA